MAVNPLAHVAVPVQMPEANSAAIADAAVVVAAAGGAAQGAGANGSAASGDGSPQPPGEQRPVERALQRINGQLQAWATQMQFDIDQDTQRVVISIKDTETGDVIRTIPSETVLRIAKMITKLQGASVQTSA